MYIQHKAFQSLCHKYFPESITTKRLLSILDDYGALKGNNGNSMRLSVKVGDNKSKRSDWIGVKRYFFESYVQLPLFPDSNDILDDIQNTIYIANDVRNRKVMLPINSSAVANNHIGISGKSGMGKSNATLHIIEELLKLGIPSIIVDS